MSVVRPALQIAWPDAMLNITKALPNFYETPAELPQQLLTLLKRMEQKPAVQQRRQPRYRVSDRARFVLAGIITAVVCALIMFLSFYYPMII
jgi:hypothetical protein